MLQPNPDHSERAPTAQGPCSFRMKLPTFVRPALRASAVPTGGSCPRSDRWILAKMKLARPTISAPPSRTLQAIPTSRAGSRRPGSLAQACPDEQTPRSVGLRRRTESFQAIHGKGVVWVDCQRCLVIGDGQFAFSSSLVHNGPIVECHSVVRSEPERVVEVDNSSIVAVHL